jgi:hypothetical protein
MTFLAFLKQMVCKLSQVDDAQTPIAVSQHFAMIDKVKFLVLKGLLAVLTDPWFTQ